MSASLNRKLQQARDRLQAGDIAGTERVCRDILQQAPRNPEACWLLGMSQLMSGRIADGADLLERVITVAPDHGPALEHLGLARLMLAQYDAAEHVLRKAASLPSAPASVSMRLGAALLHLGRAPEALQQLTRAAQRDPRNVDVHVNLGQAYARIGDSEKARAAFTDALALSPAHADAMYNLGVIELERDALAEARLWFERAMKAAPDHVDALVNLGIVARRSGDQPGAIECFERALRIAPASAPALDNLGQTLLAAGQHAAARERFLAALKAEPGSLSAREGMVAACHALERYAEAQPYIDDLLRAEPDNEYGLQARAQGLFQIGQLDPACAAAARAVDRYPQSAGAYAVLAQIHIIRGELEDAVNTLETGYAKTGAEDLLGLYNHQLRKLCDWERWSAAWTKMREAIPHSARLGSPFNLLCEDTTAREQLDYTRRWAAARFGNITTPPRTARVARTQRQRARIGYMTSDFYEHPVGYLLAEVMELHDRNRIEVFAYSYGPDDHSATRARYCAAAEHFIDISRTPDDVAVERIEADDLDLLIDLHGYTVGDRLAILARRPCAIQATWLGYPCTTGAPFIDYLIADPHVIPEGAEGDYASERVMRLPHCYQPNDRKRPRLAALSRGEYGLPDDAFVFCCFNQLFKITPDIYSCWMRLLRDVPNSVLWLMLDHPAAVERLRRYAEARDVDPQRVIFAPRIPLPQHLARYGASDLALDTYPYTSHTTASDALWGDCPLVGLSGNTFASRVSGSILTSAGLSRLVTRNLDDYYALAHALATTPHRLSEVLTQVRQAKTTSALFDTERFTRDLETLYERIITR
jgi:protein O-GlcNAc transferase